MKQKRKAAADIFKEQNIMAEQAYQEHDELDEVGVESEVRDVQMPQMTNYSTPPSAPKPVSKAKKKKKKRLPFEFSGMKTSEELQLEKEPIRVRETGFWIWKKIIVPPNAYVVHTRLGKEEPVTVGLGVSFRYNPYTDAYLVVPAAMQTIGVVANCISKEKQGINVLAYVQWQIADFSIAYRKLDFSDPQDPLGIVNAQLREQAEAAIKDKISTMSVEEVLTDKEPVIEELTARLKVVAEGRVQGQEVSGEGLGIKIVTVQIKEAYVSSQNLWENLQAPFRHQKEKTARISYLAMEDEIHEKELMTRKASETREVETKVEIEHIRQTKETESQELRLTQESLRFNKEQETIQEKIKLEEQTKIAQKEFAKRQEIQAAQSEKEVSQLRKDLETEEKIHEIEKEGELSQKSAESEHQRIAREMELKEKEIELKLKLQEQEDLLTAKAQQARLEREKEQHLANLKTEEESNRIKLEFWEKQMEILRLEQENRNLINEKDLRNRLIEKLPEIAAQMPDIDELKVFQSDADNSGLNSVAAFVAKVFGMAEDLGIKLKPKPEVVAVEE